MVSRWKIPAKLFVLVGTLMACMLFVGGYGLHALTEAQERAASALERKRLHTNAVDAARAAEVAFKLQVQEFKNVLLRGHEPADLQRHVAGFEKDIELVRNRLDALQGLMNQLSLPVQDVEEARRMHAAITQEYTGAIRQLDAQNPESVRAMDRQVRGKDRPLDTRIDAIVASLQDFARKDGALLAESAAAQSRQVILVLGAIMLLVLLAGSAFGLWIVRGITGPLRQAVAASQRIAQGDLTVDLRTRRGDEVGELLEALSQMTQELRRVVGEVVAGSHTVADSSAQIAQGNLDLSQRTEEQASTLEETASQMEELTSTVTQNADNARQASQVAATAAEVARKGGAAVADVVHTMSGISESSRKISDIIGVIDGIAFQTNILALNAAVEAARAGEQGRGFAVVAAEVRNLAQRSAAAAKEIKALIVDSVEKVEAGTRLVDDAGHTMQDIVASVKKVNDLITEIAAASQEQSAGIEQVNTAVTQMDQVVQQNASLVEEATAATESMKAQAQALLRMVSRFRLDEAHQPAMVLQPVREAAARSQLAPSVAPVTLSYPKALRPAHAGAAKAHEEWQEF
jgi:methyl-accepting chemotaxis protein-1 (serine sensor receptor)